MNELQQLEDIKRKEIKSEIKIRFDYEIPIVHVEKAGISSTGGKSDNELIEVSKEFCNYRKKNKLWDEQRKPVTYEIQDDNVYRLVVSDVKGIYE